jgi:hypothetical protein
MKRTALALALALLAFGAAADPVRCVDASGKVRYVDSSMAGNDKCSPVASDLQVLPSPPSGNSGYRPPSSSSSDGPAPNAQESQLREAQSQLAEAKQKLAEQEAIRTGDERNYQRVLERLKPYQDAVQRAEQNLEKAQREAR